MFQKLGLLGLLLCAVAVQADVLVMDNGDRITGRLDSISGGKAIFDTSYAGRIWVEMANIRSLETEGLCGSRGRQIDRGCLCRRRMVCSNWLVPSRLLS